MYDPSITSKYLSKQNPFVIVDEGQKTERKQHFELQYHSVSETQQMIAHLNTLINLDAYESSKETSSPKVQPYRNLNEDELIWIENEKTICQWDCDYFQDHYYKILNSEGQWEQFKPLIPQRVNRRIRRRLQKAGLAIRKWTVKARQQGETTDSEGVILHRVNYFSDVKALVSSMDLESSGKLADICISSSNQLPWWNRAHLKAFETGVDYTFENDSLLDIGWGTKKSLGRGRTPLLYHGTEIPFYKYPQKALEEGLFNAMHESIWMMQLVEGTAETRDDYYHNKYKEIIEGMEAGTTSWVFCFHPWCARTDLFPTKTWLRARSAAYEKWIPSKEIIAHANKLQSWVLNNPDYRAEYGENWHLPREQMFYYEIEKAAAEKRNELHKFLKEKPSDPEEAFQYAGQSIYPIQTIVRISDEAQRKIPDVYKMIGDPNEVNPMLMPEESIIDYNKPRIKIKAHWNKSIPSSNFELVPIQFQGWSNFDPQNKILIWELPNRNATYGSSVDTSDGLGVGVSDDAVQEVVKKGTVTELDKQVCEFVSASLPQNMFWPVTLAINTLYSPVEQLLFCPEINKGTELMNLLMQRGWENIIKMIDMSLMEKDIYSIKKVGFDTNPRTRNEIINTMHSFILGHWIDIYSMPLIQEMKDLVKKTTVSPIFGKEKKKLQGKKDNRFIAMAILLYCLHRNEIMGLEKATWEMRIANESSIVELKSFEGFDYDKLDNDEGLVYDPFSDEEEDNLIALLSRDDNDGDFDYIQ